MSQRELARKMREAQGQTPAVEINGRQYVFRKLKRKKCHQVLYNLVAPFIRIVAALIETVAIPIGKLTSGEFDVEALLKSDKLNTDTLASVLESLPFDDFWALACNILDSVEIDGIQYGKLDDHEFFDDKPFEMLKAMLKGIEVNYPFLGDLIKKKENGKDDSSQTNQAQMKG